MKKIFILTGEASGDKLASKVNSKLKKDNLNIDYLSGTYSEYGDGDNASEPDKSSDGLTRLAIGVGARYNF